MVSESSKTTLLSATKLSHSETGPRFLLTNLCPANLALFLVSWNWLLFGVSVYLVRIQRASRSGQSCCTIHCCSCCDRTERVLFSLRMERVRSSPACPCSSIHKTNAKSKVYRLTTRVHRGGGGAGATAAASTNAPLTSAVLRSPEVVASYKGLHIWLRKSSVRAQRAARTWRKRGFGVGEENRGNTEIYPVLACRC